MKVDARMVKRLSVAFELNVDLKSDAAVTVLLGPSGAGKTLALSCLGGFAKPDEGRILIDDQLYFDAATGVHLSPQKRRCGYIFQDHALFPHMTVMENLRFGAKQTRLNKRRQITDLLEAFELGELADRKPAQLSGGQKQRAALARTLVSEPRLLLLDEPTRGLDLRLRQAFYAVLKTTRERLQAPIVLVTHDLDECLQVADYVFLMEAGRFTQCGPREQLFACPANLDVARSLGIYNLLPAMIISLDPGRNTSRLEVLGEKIEGPYFKGHLIGDHGYLCIRQTETRVSAKNGQITLAVQSVSPSMRGVRIGFEYNVAAEMSETEFDGVRGLEQLRVEIPSSAVYFLAK